MKRFNKEIDMDNPYDSEKIENSFEEMENSFEEMGKSLNRCGETLDHCNEIIDDLERSLLNIIWVEGGCEAVKDLNIDGEEDETE